MELITFISGIIREALAKKIILSVFIFFSLILLFIVFIATNDSVDGIVAFMQASGGAEDYRSAVIYYESGVVSKIPMFMVTAFYLIIVSSFIPSMLQKGHIDLLLSKPISRTKIIMGHLLAGVIFAFLSSLFLFGIVWVIVSVKTGVWHIPFLYSVFWFTFIFLVLYSFMILTGLLTKNTVLNIIINLILFFPLSWIFYILTVVTKKGEQFFSISGVTGFIIKLFYYIFPKPWDLADICESIIKQESIASFQPIITSLLFIGIMLSLSIWYFNKKDY
jgi:ABC-type transport system involved in multi-copper enzyme maturation permease subunit